MEGFRHMKPFITGTAAYGPFTEDSDIDIVMFYPEAAEFKEQLEAGGIKTREPNREINPHYEGFEFDIADRTFQIVCVVNDTDYNEWLYATEEMRFQDEQEDRKKRIALFNELKEKCYE
jgi:hypothetical protein